MQLAVRLLLCCSAAFGQQALVDVLSSTGEAAGNRVLADRAVRLEELLRRDPEAAAGLLLPEDTASRLRSRFPNAARWIEQTGSWEGEIQITVLDDFEHGRSRIKRNVRTIEGVFELIYGKANTQNNLKSGMRVRVAGVKVGGSIALPQVTVVGLTTACTTTGTQSVAYILATMPGGPAFPSAFTPSTIQQSAFGATGVSLNTYWQEASYGKTSATGGVFGPFALSQSYTCDQSDAMETAVFNAAAGSVNLANYNRIAVVFPVSSCSYGGLGTLGCETLPNGQVGSFAWFPIFSYQSLATFPGILAHEHGHNLGLDHSSTADYGSVPLSSLSNNGLTVEYGDPFSVMGMAQQSQNGAGILGHYISQHKSLFLGWLQDGSGYREITQSGTYSVLPYETTNGIRALRILRDAATSSWLWLEYRQPIGAIDSTLAHLSTNVMSGALIHYENPKLDSEHTYQADFTPASTPNNFYDGALAAGQTWTDPVSPLRLTVVSAASTGLTVAVNYDAQCAAVPSSVADMAASGGNGSLTITAPAGCAWSVTTTDSWLTFTSPTSGSGSGSVSYNAGANGGTAQRTGYFAVNRQSVSVLQLSTAETLMSASPATGSGTSTTITFDFTDSAGYTNISYVNINFLGDPGCEIQVQRSSRYAFLLNDAGVTYNPLNLAVPSATVSNSQCTVFSSGSSIGGSGQQLTVTLHVTFAAAFSGTHTIYANAVNAASTASNMIAVGSWTVPVATVADKIGFFLPSLPAWALDANGNGTFDGTAAGDKFFTFAGQPGAIALSGDWNGDGRSKVGVYYNGFWALDYNGDGVFNSSVDKFYGFGGADSSYVPIVGDWNWDGRTKVGFYRNGFWALDTNGDGIFDSGDSFYGYGGNGAGEVPVVGDWTGDKRTKVGFYYKGLWVLDTNGDGTFNAGDKYYTGFAYLAGDKPVVGDWTGDGIVKIGVYRNGFWVLDYNGNGVYENGIDKFYAFGGNTGEVPLIGDWNGDGRSKVGVYVNGFWILDYNGDGTFNGSSIDKFYAFGGSGYQPIIGKW